MGLRTSLVNRYAASGDLLNGGDYFKVAFEPASLILEKMRIKSALYDLERDKNPLFHKDMRPLTGQLKGDYRLRVGDWRLFLTPDREKKTIYVYAILPRDDAY